MPTKSGHPTKKETQNFENSRDNVNLQLKEAGISANAQQNRLDEKEQTYPKRSCPENVFETPPNSLTCNIPISVLETTANSIDSLQAVKPGTEPNTTNDENDDENVSDSTLVTSASHSGSDPSEDVTVDSKQLACDGKQPLEDEKSGQQWDNKQDELCEGRYNPAIPVQEWSPVKVPNTKENVGPSENVECYNEGRGLPPDQWTPTNSHKQQVEYVL